MAMELSIPNLFQFCSAMAPLLLVFGLVFISMFNGDLKGIIYLVGVLAATTINSFIAPSVGKKTSGDLPQFCNLIKFPRDLDEYVYPAHNSMFIAFTLAYLWFPMIWTSKNINYPVLIFIFGLLGVDSVSKLMNGCTTFVGVFTGAIVGFALGAAWWAIFNSRPEFLFFGTETSNNVVCSRPKKQTFKCNVYKNGEIVASNQ